MHENSGCIQSDLEISILCVLEYNCITELINLSPNAGAPRLD